MALKHHLVDTLLRHYPVQLFVDCRYDLDQRDNDELALDYGTDLAIAHSQLSYGMITGIQSVDPRSADFFLEAYQAFRDGLSCLRWTLSNGALLTANGIIRPLRLRMPAGWLDCFSCCVLRLRGGDNTLGSSNSMSSSLSSVFDTS
jgi:hypothetical protein